MGEAADQLGVQAQFLVDKFRAGLKEYERGLKDGAKAQEEFRRRVQKSSGQADKSIQSSVLSMRQNWLQASAAIAVVTAAVVKGYQKLEDAARARGMREAFQAMGNFYGVDTGTLIGQLKEISDQTLSTSQAVQVANQAMLAGGAAFASEIPRVFEIARAAATATGKDVMWVFETLTRGIAKGSPLLIDNAELYLSIGSALDDYAAKLGKSSDELTRQEKTQATLNAVLEQGAPLVDAIGDKALDATQPFDELKAALKDFWDALMATITAGPGFEEFLQSAVELVRTFTQVTIMSIAGLKGLWAVLTTDPLEWVKGEVHLLELFDETVSTSFLEGARAMGEFETEGDQVENTIEDIGTATEDTSDKLDEFNQKIEDLRVKYTEQLVDMQTQAAQWEIDTAIKRARRLEDIERDAARQRADIHEQYAAQIRNAETQYHQAVESAKYEHGRRMADIERQYQERVRQIQQQYQETTYEAIANRDATAALKAMRRRDSDLEDAQRQRDQQRADAAADYAKQMNDLRVALQQQREEARRARDQQLRDLEENVRRQREELDRSLQRQREDQQRHNQWKLQAMHQQYNAEYQAALSAYTGQENAYRQHLLNMRSIWAQFAGGIGTTHAGQLGRQYQGTQYLAEGGALIASQPTHLVVGEGRYPELVVAQPLTPVPAPAPSLSANVSGAMRHEVTGTVQAMMAGYEGRLSNAISSAVIDAVSEIIR